MGVKFKESELDVFVLVLNVVVFSVCLPLAFVSWLRMAKNIILIIVNADTKFCKSHSLLKFNRLNALLVPSALNEVGLIARKQVFISAAKFVAFTSAPMVLFMLTG